MKTVSAASSSNISLTLLLHSTKHVAFVVQTTDRPPARAAGVRAAGLEPPDLGTAADERRERGEHQKDSSHGTFLSLAFGSCDPFLPGQSPGPHLQYTEPGAT